MDSLYAEVVVKPKQSVVRKVIIGVVVLVLAFLLYLAVKASVLYSDVYPIFFCVPVFISVGAITIYFHKMGKIEYEYIYCDDVIDIAKIKAKQKRKNVVRIETDNIEMFAPLDSAAMKNYETLPKRDFTSAKKVNPIYALITVVDGKKVRVLLEPSEKMLEGLKIKLGTRIVCK